MEAAAPNGVGVELPNRDVPADVVAGAAELPNTDPEELPNTDPLEGAPPNGEDAAVAGFEVGAPPKESEPKLDNPPPDVLVVAVDEAAPPKMDALPAAVVAVAPPPKTDPVAAGFPKTLTPLRAAEAVLAEVVEVDDEAPKIDPEALVELGVPNAGVGVDDACPPPNTLPPPTPKALALLEVAKDDEAPKTEAEVVAAAPPKTDP